MGGLKMLGMIGNGHQFLMELIDGHYLVYDWKQIVRVFDDRESGLKYMRAWIGEPASPNWR
jgi:hypothetical protein